MGGSKQPRQKKKTLSESQKFQNHIRSKATTLYLGLIEVLEERIEDRTIEPQEMRLIMEIVKQQEIGVQSVDEIVADAHEQAAVESANVTLDDAWGFTEDTVI